MRYLTLAAVTALLLGGAARADFVYEFATAGTGTFGTAFSVNQGSTLTLQVYLAQTTPSTNLSANGLSQGGVALQYPSAGSPFSIPSSGSITPNPAFLGPNNTSLGTSGGTTTGTLQVNSASPVFPTATDGGGNQAVLLGTVTLNGNTAGTGILSAVLPDSSGTNNVDGAGNFLDSLVHNASAVITVNAIPEPGSLVLTGLAASAIGFGAWKRLRKTPAVPA
jgi:hypothetical protein